jgi:chemotaxis protein methyltransferase CheR
MFLKHNLKKMDPSFDFKIFGSDIDPASVEVGRNGVYHMEEVKKIPSIYLKDNWLQGKGDISSFYKIKEDIRSKCTFDSVNLFELEKKVTEKFDVIFCRNVFIYFKPEQVKILSEKMISMLEPWGVFITGTSESLASHRLNIKMLAPST